MTTDVKPFTIAGQTLAPGTQKTIELPFAQLYTHTPLNMTMNVFHGRKPGPVLLISAAIHGDEINGVEIIRRLIKLPELKRLRGTLIAVPIVNLFGFIHRSRYLPDRRDLNRSFPGSAKGSLAGRLAYFYKTNILVHATHAIDLHTAAIHRENYPQLLFSPKSPDSIAMAEAFGAPFIIPSIAPEGALRNTSKDLGIPMIVYEGGEALRFDENVIRAGLRGIRRVMQSLQMLPQRKTPSHRRQPILVKNCIWIRSDMDGLLRPLVSSGQSVDKGQTLGIVSDPYGDIDHEVIAPEAGVVIGRSNIPMVNDGEACFKLAILGKGNEALDEINEFQQELENIVNQEPPIV